MTTPNTHAPAMHGAIEALRDLRLGVEMDRHNLDDGYAKLQALDAAIEALSKLRAPVADERALPPGPWQAERPRNRSALIVWRWCQNGSPTMRREYLRADGKIASTPGRFRSWNDAHAAIDRAALASAPADPEAAEVDFLVRVLENLDTWRAEEWSELLERRPAILAMLRPMVMASAPVAGESVCKTCGGSRVDPGGLPICRDCSAAPQASEAVRDAPFETVRKRLCAIPRYSFYLDDDGVVRHVEGCSGNWIEFDAAHELFDPVAVDAALSAQPGPQKNGGGDAPTACDSEVMREAAWHECRRDVGTGGWTAAEAFNYRGFFMHGWRAALSSQTGARKRDSDAD